MVDTPIDIKPGGDIAVPPPLTPVVPEFVVPDDPSFIKAINKESGNVVLLKRDALSSVNVDQYEPYSTAGEARVQRIRSKLSSLEGSPWYIPGSVDLAKEHGQDDIMTPDGKYKLQSADGKPLDLGPREAVDALKNPSVKFRDTHAQELYEAQLLYKSTLQSRLTGAAREAAPGLSEEDTKELQRQPINPEKPMKNWVTEGAFIDDKMGILADRVLADTKFANERLLAKAIGVAGELYLTKGEGLYGEFRGGATAARELESTLAGNAPGLARKAAAWSAGKALEGAIITSPEAIAQLNIDRDPKLAAETLALGAGLNVGLNIFGKALTTPLRGFEAGAEKLRPLAVDAALKEAGATDEVLTRLGNAEQREIFLKNLVKAGADEANSVNKMESVLNKMKNGEGLIPTLEKLDPYLAKETNLATNMKTDLAKMIDDVGVLKPEVKDVGNALYNQLDKMTDKEGRISLADFQKFIQSAGEGIKVGKEDAVDAFRAGVQENAINKLLTTGDLAASKADGKIAALWTNQKASAELAKTMHTNLVGSGLNDAFNPTFKFLKKLVTSKAAHIVTGAMGLHGGIGGFAISQLAHKGVEKGFDMLEHYLANSDTKLGKLLSSKMQSPAAASYLALDAIHSTTKKIQDIPEFIKQIGTKTGARFSSDESPIKLILGAQANGLSKEQQFNKLSSHISMMAGNPELRQQHLQEITIPLSVSHPNLAQQVIADYENKIQYLSQILPKDSSPPKPFTKKEGWKPSKAELDDFEAQLRVAHNPFTLLDRMKEGKVTPKEVATASVLNPTILAHIREEMAKIAFSGKVDMTYQQKLNASTLMGEAMHQSLNNVQALQGVYGGAPPESMPVPPGASGGKGRKGGASHLNADKAVKASQTMSQRLMGK